MKIGILNVTPEGLRVLARSIEVLGGTIATLEIHKDDDTHGVLRACCTKESGWIDLEKGFYHYPSQKGKIRGEG